MIMASIHIILSILYLYVCTYVCIKYGDVWLCHFILIETAKIHSTIIIKEKYGHRTTITNIEIVGQY